MKSRAREIERRLRGRIKKGTQKYSKVKCAPSTTCSTFFENKRPGKRNRDDDGNEDDEENDDGNAGDDGGGEKGVVNAVIGEPAGDSSLLERVGDEDDVGNTVDVASRFATPSRVSRRQTRFTARLRCFYLVTVTARWWVGLKSGEWD